MAHMYRCICVSIHVRVVAYHQFYGNITKSALKKKVNNKLISVFISANNKCASEQQICVSLCVFVI